MMNRKCDACKVDIVESSFIQLSKRTLDSKLDNNQKVEVTLGDYCSTCLKNGNAIKDLLHGTNGTN